jgi:ribosomal protein S12 methylthiotransferase
MEKKVVSAAVVTLGCARNEVESDFARGSLRDSGFELVKSVDEAEVILVNTCGFIEPAKQESIDTILELAQLKLKGKCRSLILAGCLGERYPQELFSSLPEVDAVVGISGWSQLESIIAQTLKGKRLVSVGKEKEISEKGKRYVEYHPSAYLQIADGCNRCCSYCAIPLIRGRYRSRPLSELVEEAEQLTRAGAREMNLIAQDISQYGFDLYGETKLADLLGELAAIENLEWIRLLYFDPAGVRPDVMEKVATNEKICHYLDIPFQHGSDRILKAMKRPGTKKEYLRIIENLRTAMPDVALRTSVIVGFPGETEREFRELAGFIKEAEFDYLGVFQFSPEEGTKAFSMPSQVPPEIRQERYHALLALQEKIRVEKNRELMGKTFEILVERKTKEDGFNLTGRNRRQAPEVDGEVYVEGKAEPGDLIKARIEKAEVYDLFGEQVW